MRIGVIGLGLMGTPIVRRLIGAGHDLFVFDRDPEKCNIPGAAACKNAREVAAESDFILTALPTAKHVEEVLREALPFARRGALFIDMSTIESEKCLTMRALATDAGCSFMDAPVTGGVEGAENGSLSILAGASERDFERALPVLSVLGRKITRMGEVGAGQLAKCCNQVVGAITLQAVCEGLMLAKKAGLDIETLLGAMEGGASDSFMLKYVGSRALTGDAAPGFRVRLELKDLGIALDEARRTETPLPALALVNQLFVSRAAAGGLDSEGNQALIRVYEELSHYPPQQ